MNANRNTGGKIRWSAIIPTLNRVDTLMGTLACLTAQTLPPADFEALVVDNGSTDATPERVRAFMAGHPAHRIRYIREGTPGLLAGRHRGTREAEAGILTFFDDDVELGPDFALHILKTFADDKVALAGGPCRPKFEAEPPAWLERYWIRDREHAECGYLSLVDYGDKARDIDPGQIWGLNYSIRKRALRALGGFHPDGMPDSLLMFRGDGESGLSAKAKNQGLLARYVPELLVMHCIPAHRVSEEGLKKRFFAQGVSDSYTEIRRYGSPCGRLCPLPVEESPGEEAMHARIHNAYVDGYYFHQHAAHNSAKLLKWILRHDYWDYACPELEKGAAFPRSFAAKLLSFPLKTLSDPDKVWLAIQYLANGRPVDALHTAGQVERAYPGSIDRQESFMSDDKDTIVAAYWNDPAKDPRYVGSYPIGTGQTLEIPYRHWGEWETFSRRLPPPPFSLLELGCGAGRWAFSLAPLVSRYVGVDLSAEQIRVAREHAARSRWNHLEFLVDNIMSYDPGEARFDCVYLSGVAMYLEDEVLAALLSRIRLWLKPGGLLAERDSTFVGPARHVRNDGGYFAVYRLPGEIIDIFTRAGFSFREEARSYSILRTHGLWKSHELREFMQWGIKHLPAAAFALMQGYSDFVSKQSDPYCHEGDKTYDHRFFFFTPPLKKS